VGPTNSNGIVTLSTWPPSLSARVTVAAGTSFSVPSGSTSQTRGISSAVPSARGDATAGENPLPEICTMLSPHAVQISSGEIPLGEGVGPSRSGSQPIQRAAHTTRVMAMDLVISNLLLLV
jgi:hypothetical protein